MNGGRSGSAPRSPRATNIPALGGVIERRLSDVGFTVLPADYHAPLHGTSLLRKLKPGEQN